MGPPAAVLPFSYFIDADGDTSVLAKTQIGDVEVYRRSCRAPSAGIIKVCKVAGPGVTLGTRFNFTGPPHSAAVRAGPPPGGFCKVLGSDYDIPSRVNVTETGPLGYGVTSIRVDPPDRLTPGTINLAVGSVGVNVGPGVTEVTFTNERRTGYIEICKEAVGDPLLITGDFSFTLSPAGPAGAGPFIVPADACTPAIATLGGEITITEARRAGYDMSNACSTLPADRQGACNARRRTSVVSVAAGDISTQTIAFIQNQSRRCVCSNRNNRFFDRYCKRRRPHGQNLRSRLLPHDARRL